MKTMKDPMAVRRHLANHRLDAVFPEELVPHLALIEYGQGETVCRQGERSQAVYFLVQGKVKIYTTSAEGKTLIVSFKHPPEIVGDVEYARGAPILNTVEAVTSVVMILVPHVAMRQYGERHAPLMKHMLDVVANKFYDKSNALSFNLLYPVDVRLAGYLLSASFDSSGFPNGGRLDTGRLSDAASVLGTSYRHLNRLLRQWADEGLIEREKGHILVKDRTALSAKAGQGISGRGGEAE